MKVVRIAYTILLSVPLESKKVNLKSNKVFQAISALFCCNLHCDSIRNTDSGTQSIRNLDLLSKLLGNPVTYKFCGWLHS